jgi:hypothetical protein
MIIYSIFVIFLAAMVFSLSLNVFLKNKEHSSRAFAFTLSMIGLWVLSIALSNLFYGINNDLSALSVRYSYFFGTLISFSFLYFSLAYTDNEKPASFVRYSLLIGGLAVFVFYFFKDILSLFAVSFSEDTIVSSVYQTEGGYLGWYSEKYMAFFFIIFFGAFCAAIATLWQKYKQQTDEKIKRQALFIFWVITSGAVPSGILNTILPWLGIFDFVWMGVVLTSGWVVTIWYWMFRFAKSNDTLTEVK